MNYTEYEYFEMLSRDRNESADTFEKPANRKIWKGIVEKYSDQAHFIYELIQNADDAGATFARFKLENERLIFAHNGNRHFSISNPGTEDADFLDGKLGDINAITGISFSSKKSESNRIGKFGVGFKSVFQYTSTPHIYDPCFRFYIDRYIVPHMIEGDFPDRKHDETLFVFPFNHAEKDAEETFKDISAKLKSLVYPVLFLANLMTVTYEINGEFGVYEKNISESEITDDTVSERINLLSAFGKESRYTHFRVFSRFEETMRYSVGYQLDDKGHLKPADTPAFCFFPTREKTGLKFLVHAPFLLNDSREGIRAGIPHNNYMIELLSDLAADSMEYLRDISIRNNDFLIRDDIVEIIPVSEDEFSAPGDTEKISFRPFCTKIKNAFATRRLIPTKSGYKTADKTCLAADSKLTDIFSDDMLADICEERELFWGFPSVSAGEIQKRSSSLFLFLTSVTKTVITEEDILAGRKINAWSSEKEIRGIDAGFIEFQETEWLFRFYSWISGNETRINLVRTLPVFPDQNMKAAAAYDENGIRILFLPSDEIKGYRTLNEDILKNEAAAELAGKLGVTEPSLQDQIYNVMIPELLHSDTEDTDKYFTAFYNYYSDIPRSASDDFIRRISKCRFIRSVTADGKKHAVSEAHDIYMPYEELTEFFSSETSFYFADLDYYSELLSNENNGLLREFLEKCGVRTKIRAEDRVLSAGEISERDDLPEPFAAGEIIYTEKCIPGCIEIMHDILENCDMKKSGLLWNVLLNIISEECMYGSLDNYFRGSCEYFDQAPKRIPFESHLSAMLKNTPWIADAEGNFYIPQGISASELSSVYCTNGKNAEELMNFLGISCVSPESAVMPDIRPISRQIINSEDDISSRLSLIKYTNDSDQSDNLYGNIQLVLGKKGDIKIKRLVDESVMPLLLSKENRKIIIVSDSGDKADRITEFLADTTGETFLLWLIRFGSTGNVRLLQSGIVKKSGNEISVPDRCVFVTTVKEYVSGYFKDRGKITPTGKYRWDTVIIESDCLIPEAVKELLLQFIDAVSQ
ncbi:MAG: hypothetical protein Q4D76_06635 [Oscillospiraceae bacterium]|nr:hypothetical protein [Oscillospiraceae bacterium]